MLLLDYLLSANTLHPFHYCKNKVGGIFLYKGCYKTMNKNKLFTACMLSGALLVSQAANAEEQSYLSNFTSKINQGIFNIATGFIEIPKNIVNISHDQNILVGLSWGTLRGVAHAVSRTVVGSVELLSSPIPSDEFISPPYVWERFSEDSRYFGLYIPGYWTSYGPLDHGK